MLTIKDVAREANLSPTTVSRVLNNRGYISEKTRKLVYDTMEKLNYHPNKIARSLQSNTSNLIAIIVPDSSNPFFSELVANVERQCMKHNYRLILCNSFDTYEKESEYLQLLQEQNIDGLIACSHILDENSYRNISFPVVSFDKDYKNESIPIICSDNYLGGTIAAQHLYEKGCKRLLHIAGPLTDKSLLGHGRHLGFKNYCEKNGVETVTYSTENHFSVEYYRSFILENVRENLSSFDGAFCSNDLIAFALYQVLREKNISVPNDFKIVGFDHTVFTKTVIPKLTTVSQNIPLIAKCLVDTLLEMQNGGSPERGVVKLDVRLVQGETT
ncbi:MAG: LacI family transcriptional regulator [Clostridia bacterium]|nr:LacI family transcriptional regulator [Clostridia bacterium]